MGVEPVFDPETWARVPFHFWTVVFFVFGSIVGSFLNVCIHRLPLGQSIVSPPSHCPHCKYSIPWYLNLPLVTWLWLGARCRNCAAPISARYFVVELMTALVFAGTWLAYGRHSVAVVLVFCLFLSGLIAASFIDFEHLIIPDEITVGGMVAGVLCSVLVPRLHAESSVLWSLVRSLGGLVAGAAIIYAISRMGKAVFGRKRVRLAPGSRIVFGESALHLPRETLPYEDLFYRSTDAVTLQADTVELIDRCYRDVPVRVTPEKLEIGGEQMDPETVPQFEVTCARVTLPREAMGLGDVKFMAAIGAFLGWQGVLFSLTISALIGACTGVAIMIVKWRRISLVAYGPFIAVAAALWVFAGHSIVEWYRELLLGIAGR